MFDTRSEYDKGVNTFSREGRLLQVENATKAIQKGTSAVGIKVDDGVVLSVHRKLNSKLIEPKSIQKVVELDEHIASAASGIVTDAKTIVEYARVESQNHKFTYGEPISVKSLTRSICDLALHFGEGDPTKREKPMSRPFGVALLVGGIDETGPCLYQTDPTGTMLKYEARGIGPAEESIKLELESQYKPNMSLKEAETLALLCLKKNMEEDIDNLNVELVTIPTATKKVEFRSEQYVAEILKTLP